MIDKCPHEVWERSAAVEADGLCPLCLKDEVKRLREEVERLRGMIPNYLGLYGSGRRT